MSAESVIEGILSDQENLAREYKNYTVTWGALTQDTIARIADPGDFDLPEPDFAEEGRYQSTLAPAGRVNADGLYIGGLFEVTDPTEREEQGGIRAIPEFLAPSHPDACEDQGPDFIEMNPVQAPPDELPSSDELAGLRANTLTMPDDPNRSVESFRGEVPDIDFTVTLPDWPDINEAFEPLELLTITPNNRDATVSLPTYINDRPVFQGETPGADDYKNTLASAITDGRAMAEANVDDWFNKRFPGYDAQVAALDAHLASVANGDTTAWNAKVEAAIYNRRRARTNAEALRVKESIHRVTARRGFLGTLVASAADVRADQDAHDANALAAYEVAEQAANREAAFLENAIQQISQNRALAVQMELQKQQLVIAQAQFALEYGRAMVEACIQAHNAAIARYNADIARYQADAQVYEVQVRAALQEIEAIKVELEAERLKIDINRSLIDELEAKIKIEQLKVEFYTQRVQAKVAEANIRRLPLELFRAQIEEHSAMISTRQLETDIYRAAVDGRQAELATDASRIEAYRAKVAAYAEKVRALRDRDGHDVEINRQILEQHRYYLDLCKTELDRKRGVNDDERRFDGMRLDRWSRLIERDIAENDRALRRDIAISRHAATYDQMEVDWARSKIAQYIEKIRTQTEILDSVTRTLGELASATLAANGSTVSLANETLSSE